MFKAVSLLLYNKCVSKSTNGIDNRIIPRTEWDNAGNLLSTALATQ